MRRLPIILAVLTLVIAGTLAPGLRDDRADASVTVSLTLLKSGFDRPLGIVNAGDGSGRLFVVEQTGRIRIITAGGTLLPDAFLDIHTLITQSCATNPPGCGEQGLLGLAFHPDYETNGYFYVYYTDNDTSVDGAGDTVVARYQCCLSGDVNRADTGIAPVPVLAVEQPYTNHNGGQLQFGPDGYLYIGLGDGGSGDDPENRAQDPTTLLGKILRIDINGGGPYAIPPSNPYASPSDGVLNEIWAIGMRNPWRFTFDRLTGDLFIGDVGQIAREEVDFQPAGDPGGRNYGWRLMEGSICKIPSTNCDDGSPVLTYPNLEYPHTSGNCSITGGYRYRGLASNSLAGVYLYADYCTGRIWGATDSGGGNWTTAEALTSPTYNISTFGEDEGGELYVAHISEAPNGAIYRVVGATGPDGDGDGWSDASDNCPSNANPLQTNSDSTRLDAESPPGSGSVLAGGDATNPHGDGQGDICDGDDDNDGLADGAEAAGCNGSGALGALDFDSDDDLFPDGYECANGTNPGLATSRPPYPAGPADSDSDGLLDGIEKMILTFGGAPNFDGDACSDAKENASVNGDSLVTSADLSAVAQRFGSYRNGATGVAVYARQVYDFNRDATISSSDLSAVAQRFGGC